MFLIDVLNKGKWIGNINSKPVLLLYIEHFSNTKSDHTHSICYSFMCIKSKILNCLIKYFITILRSRRRHRQHKTGKKIIISTIPWQKRMQRLATVYKTLNGILNNSMKSETSRCKLLLIKQESFEAYLSFLAL